MSSPFERTFHGPNEQWIADQISFHMNGNEPYEQKIDTLIEKIESHDPTTTKYCILGARVIDRARASGLSTEQASRLGRALQTNPFVTELTMSIKEDAVLDGMQPLFTALEICHHFKTVTLEPWIPGLLPQMTADFSDQFVQSIGRNQGIETVHLDSMDFSPGVLSTILSSASSLQDLRLTKCNWDPHDSDIVALRNCHTLHTLKIRAPTQFLALHEGIAGHPTLRQLLLYENRDDEQIENRADVAIQVSKAIGSCLESPNCTLQHLELDSFYFLTFVMRPLVQAFHVNRSVSKLSLSKCTFIIAEDVSMLYQLYQTGKSGLQSLELSNPQFYPDILTDDVLIGVSRSCSREQLVEFIYDPEVFIFEAPPKAFLTLLEGSTSVKSLEVVVRQQEVYDHLLPILSTMKIQTLKLVFLNFGGIEFSAPEFLHAVEHSQTLTEVDVVSASHLVSFLSNADLEKIKKYTFRNRHLQSVIGVPNETFCCERLRPHIYRIVNHTTIGPTVLFRDLLYRSNWSPLVIE